MKMKITREKLPKIFSTTFVGVAVIFATVVIVLYARGYRFNQDLGLVEKTGVLDVDSNPNRVDIYIDGQYKGKSPKTVSSLPEGRYKIDTTRDNYHPWETTVEIASEKSTPIYPYHFIADPQDEVVYEFEEELIFYRNQPETNYILLATKEPSTSQIRSTTEEDKLYTYKIYRYNTNPSFWSATDNPLLIWEVDGKSISIKPSTTGEYAVVQTVNEEDTNIYTLIDTSSINSDPSELNLEDVLEDGAWYWAKDDAHLVIEKEKNIFSYNLSSDVVTILTVKRGDTPWTTDQGGAFYYVNHTEEEETESKYMQINQMLLNGQSLSTLVDKIYYSESNDLLISEEELNENEELYKFTNSPNASQFAGVIKKLHVEEEIDGIILETEFATYLLDLQSDKYIIVSTVPGGYIRLSPDDRQLLYKAENELRIFTFDKLDANHTRKLGNTTLTGFENGRKPQWLENSRVLTFLDGDNFRSVDRHGENNIQVHIAKNNFYALDDSGEHLFTISIGDTGAELLRAKIN